MYRIAFIIVALLAAALGLVVGTLNSETVSVDLLWLSIEWPLGLVMLAAAAGGLFLGLLFAWLFSVVPLRKRLKKAGGKDNGYPAKLS